MRATASNVEANGRGTHGAAGNTDRLRKSRGLKICPHHVDNSPGPLLDRRPLGSKPNKTSNLAALVVTSGADSLVTVLLVTAVIRLASSRPLITKQIPDYVKA